jgi:hypothetical protein
MLRRAWSFLGSPSGSRRTGWLRGLRAVDSPARITHSLLRSRRTPLSYLFWGRMVPKELLKRKWYLELYVEGWYVALPVLPQIDQQFVPAASEDASFLFLRLRYPFWAFRTCDWTSSVKTSSEYSYEANS